MLHSLVIDSIFSGVGSVLGFLPIIVTLFSSSRCLRTSGYMARVAFVMDKLPEDRSFRPQRRADADRLRLHGAGRYGEAARCPRSATAR